MGGLRSEGLARVIKFRGVALLRAPERASGKAVTELVLSGYRAMGVKPARRLDAKRGCSAYQGRTAAR